MDVPPWTLLNSSPPSLPPQSRKSEWGKRQTSNSLLVMAGSVSTMSRAYDGRLRHWVWVEAAVFLLPCHTSSFGYILWDLFVFNSLSHCKVSKHGMLTRTSGTVSVLSGAGDICCWLVSGKRLLCLPWVETLQEASFPCRPSTVLNTFAL